MGGGVSSRGEGQAVGRPGTGALWGSWRWGAPEAEKREAVSVLTRHGCVKQGL